MENNDTSLYTVDQIRQMEKIAIEKYGISVDQLMQRAGASAFRQLKKYYPKAKNITVVCGKGNNGSDGYVVARLAKQARLKVKILSLVPVSELTGAAKRAAIKCKQLKIMDFDSAELKGSDLIVDAIFGIGLAGEVKGKFKSAINAINKSQIPVLAIDLPSGIDAEKGKVLGVAIKAAVTVTFIGPKIGLFIGDARDYTGVLISDNLRLPSATFQTVPAYGKKLNLAEEIKPLKPRKRNAHKGNFGHVLVIGGDFGMGGAIRMAAEAALRIGAGLVSVATRSKNALMLNAACPEIMAHGVSNVKQLFPLLKKASVIIAGPGLGTSKWGRDLLKSVLKVKKPKVIDADGLNILAKHNCYQTNWVLTPHPGEAGRLLNVSTKTIQNDRLSAITKIQKNFGGIIVLKGAGTLIYTKNEKIRVCDAGNPGMASAGMGDVLSGMIGGLLAQNLSLFDATKLGVLVHALAGDKIAAKKGELGILALDLLPEARRIITTQIKRTSKV